VKKHKAVKCSAKSSSIVICDENGGTEKGESCLKCRIGKQVTKLFITFGTSKRLSTLKANKYDYRVTK